ncbi:hypothetical protein ACHQM5_017931 [Ranunculus cassubicifolius]
MAEQSRSYSCNSASETLHWINAIINFLIPYKPLMDAHIVHFFKDRLWESIDNQWLDCLRDESIENLLKIPSGLVQDDWPDSLKEFILTLRALALPRDQVELQKIAPDLHVTSVGNVLAQGMNLKKKHEVETLAAIVNAFRENVGAETIIDVGAGQGYLAQVLNFQYQLSVIAIDASSHHGAVTSARAERIRKHYASKMRKSQKGTKELNVPKTVSVHVLSSDMLKALGDRIANENIIEQPNEIDKDSSNSKASLVLAGLHACGDLSVTMLRTFCECEEVKAVISIGCCYNLLSEQGLGNGNSQCGFPMSKGIKLAGFSLGKSACDLGCQSAERWKVLTKEAALQNFKLHAFRAAFQMVLHKNYPEILKKSPSIGRQGKALRRKIQQNHRTSDGTSDEKTSSSRYENIEYLEGYSSFNKFCESGIHRLGLLPCKETDILKSWNQTEPFAELIGPYWTLRACLGPVVETLILLDRLLFLQEHGNSVKAAMLPIFDPVLSPRNVAIIAQKVYAP